jgi:hypothetical protein
MPEVLGASTSNAKRATDRPRFGPADNRRRSQHAARPSIREQPQRTPSAGSAFPGTLRGVTEEADQPKIRRTVHVPSLFDLVRFAAFSGLTLLAALLAGAGRVAYTLIMLVIAAALAYAVLDLVDYELVKRNRPGRENRPG